MAYIYNRLIINFVKLVTLTLYGSHRMNWYSVKWWPICWLFNFTQQSSKESDISVSIYCSIQRIQHTDFLNFSLTWFDWRKIYWDSVEYIWTESVITAQFVFKISCVVWDLIWVRKYSSWTIEMMTKCCLIVITSSTLSDYHQFLM